MIFAFCASFIFQTRSNYWFNKAVQITWEWPAEDLEGELLHLDGGYDEEYYFRTNARSPKDTIGDCKSQCDNILIKK